MCTVILYFILSEMNPRVREKQVKFWVAGTISKAQYLEGVVGAVVWFLLFYIAAGIIALCCRCV